MSRNGTGIVLQLWQGTVKCVRVSVCSSDNYKQWRDAVLEARKAVLIQPHGDVLTIAGDGGAGPSGGGQAVALPSKKR